MDSIELKGFGSLVRVLLDVAHKDSLQEMLDAATRGICDDRPHAVRVCIWQLEEGPAGIDRRLQLASSAWETGRESNLPWRHADGSFDLVPLDEPIIGKIADTRTGSYALDEDSWPQGHPDWAKESGIVSYVAEPIQHEDSLLGVIAVFGDNRVSSDPRRLQEGIDWLRVFTSFAGIYTKKEYYARQLEWENEYLIGEVHDAHCFGEIIGDSDALKECMTQVGVVAPTEANVLIIGESGTGKELIARAVHERSLRSDHPLIKVNCASIPDNLFESEFFGHVRGAFTGAVAHREGRFQIADRGTLFLDEVGEIPLELQGKLLRVLQEGTFERIGEDRTRRVNVRIIAATNRDLQDEVRKQRFREDLFYRLNVFPIRVAPLRERREDIPLLARHFLHSSIRQLLAESIQLRFTQEQIERLCAYSWPGNVRELQNIVQRAVIKARAGNFDVELPQAHAPEPDGDADAESYLASAGTLGKHNRSDEILTEEQLRALEAANINRALDRAGGKISGPGGAAELLGINPATLSSRVKKMGLGRVAQDDD